MGIMLVVKQEDVYKWSSFLTSNEDQLSHHPSSSQADGAQEGVLVQISK
jgi:hypothetical protein